MPVYPGALESLRLSIAVVQFLLTTLSRLFHKKCNRLKARVIIYSYNHHVWLLPPEPGSSTKVYSGRGSQHCYEITEILVRFHLYDYRWRC